MPFTDSDVTEWSELTSNLYTSAAHDQHDEGLAREAMANLWSAFGSGDLPDHVLRMLIEATEIGYLTALNDLRDGALDSEILAWRPDLAEQ
jgi:hypothetical protein